MHNAPSNGQVKMLFGVIAVAKNLPAMRRGGMRVTPGRPATLISPTSCPAESDRNRADQWRSCSCRPAPSFILGRTQMYHMLLQKRIHKQISRPVPLYRTDVRNAREHPDKLRQQSCSFQMQRDREGERKGREMESWKGGMAPKGAVEHSH